MMAKEGEPCRRFEWRISFPDGMSKIFVSDCLPQGQLNTGFVMGLSLKYWGLVQKAWRYGMREPLWIIHSFKVGIALCLVSLFYYLRPLNEGVGGNGMWAVLTVVVAIEYTVGATICKCLNRVTATLLAAILGIGVHKVAIQFGEKLEPMILQTSVFILAVVATFPRFMPLVKAHFDHGALIFVFTFVLVSVSSYHDEELVALAHYRLSTIAIGISISIITSIFFCPVWAGNELHNLTQENMEKLADALDGCVAKYFGCEADENSSKTQGYKDTLEDYICVLDSLSSEESLVNFARWEPAHRGFNFRHPWKDYLELGALLRSYACCIHTLSGIVSDTKAPDFLKQHFSTFCMKLSSTSSAVLKELVVVIRTWAKSPKINLRLDEMSNTVQELQQVLKSLSDKKIGSAEESDTSPDIVSFVQLVTVSSLLIEIAARMENIVKVVNRLADKATSS